MLIIFAVCTIDGSGPHDAYVGKENLLAAVTHIQDKIFPPIVINGFQVLETISGRTVASIFKTPPKLVVTQSETVRLRDVTQEVKRTTATYCRVRSEGQKIM